VTEDPAMKLPTRRRRSCRRQPNSRTVSGLHYRYDIAAGEEIGRCAAELTLERLTPALRGE
jgi:hypothetical protein